MLPGRTDKVYEQMKIEQLAGRVDRIEPESRQAYLAGGGTISYDKLLIATGARANVYPVEGLAESAILVFRDLADAREIK